MFTLSKLPWGNRSAVCPFWKASFLWSLQNKVKYGQTVSRVWRMGRGGLLLGKVPGGGGVEGVTSETPAPEQVRWGHVGQGQKTGSLRPEIGSQLCHHWLCGLGRFWVSLSKPLFLFWKEATIQALQSFKHCLGSTFTWGVSTDNDRLEGEFG